MQADEWGEAWSLPAYPQLPKLLTSAKTAKKRKHRELIVTEELLDRPVKLPTVAGDAAAAGAAQRLGAVVPTQQGGPASQHMQCER